MLRKFVCLAAFLALLTGCSAQAQPPQSEPDTTSNTGAAQSALPAVDFSFQRDVTPGLSAEVAGFADSLWGDSVETVLSGLEGGSWSLINPDASFGGVPCEIHYVFDESSLVGGYYLLDRGSDNAAVLFQGALDYLTELYGTPDAIRLYDGNNQEVSDCAVAFHTGGGMATWGGTPFARVKQHTNIILYGEAAGEIRIAFARSGQE